MLFYFIFRQQTLLKLEYILGALMSNTKHSNTICFRKVEIHLRQQEKKINVRVDNTHFKLAYTVTRYLYGGFI